MGIDRRESKQMRARMDQPHPVWRGIGCLLFIVTPVISFAVADLLLDYMIANLDGFYLPGALRGTVDIPLYGPVNDFYGTLVFTAVISMALWAVFAIVNSMIYAATKSRNLSVFESSSEQYKKKRKLKKPR